MLSHKYSYGHIYSYRPKVGEKEERCKVALLIESEGEQEVSFVGEEPKQTPVKAHVDSVN